MEKLLKILRPHKKINLSDVAAPMPSKTTERVLKDVLIRAHDDQNKVLEKAHKSDS